MLLLHDTRTQSRKVYNEYFNNIELDSVYADLLNDYLNFFLPVNERFVSFPSFISNLSQTKQSLDHTTQSSPILSHRNYQPHTHQCLFKRVIQKSLITSSNEDDSIFNPNIPSEKDRAGDMKKIELFLRLINELLILPFTDLASASVVKLEPEQDTRQRPRSRQTSPSHSASSSPLKYKCNENLCNIEIVFALSMIVKHSHFFSNAFPLENTSFYSDLDKSVESSSLYSRKQVIGAQQSSLDELRHVLFKVYWRKTFYKFFQFNLEHWPFEPSIKWFVELWLTYIQAYKFRLGENVESSSSLSYSNLEFIKENYLIFNDVYQIVLKRYCILDLTNQDNLQLLHQILMVFILFHFIFVKNTIKS